MEGPSDKLSTLNIKEPYCVLQPQRTLYGVRWPELL